MVEILVHRDPFSFVRFEPSTETMLKINVDVAITTPMLGGEHPPPLLTDCRSMTKASRR